MSKMSTKVPFEWTCLDLAIFFKSRAKSTQRNQHKYLFLAPLSPFKILCVAVFSYILKREKRPEHKEFQGLKAPDKGGFRHGILGEIFVFGCLFGPEYFFKWTFGPKSFGIQGCEARIP